MFIFLGDVTYIYRNDEEHLSDSIKYYERRLKDTENVKGYRELKQKTRIVGIWDDNDYGKNNAGRRFEERD